MTDRLLADAVVLVHVLFIVFVVLGGLLVLRWGWVAWLHIPAALWGALVELFGWWCPLTGLEDRFRGRAAASGYPGGFIERCLVPLVYPGELTRAMQVGLGVFVVLLNLAVYLEVRRSRRRTRAGRPSSFDASHE